jgi:hypothetical protein
LVLDCFNLIYGIAAIGLNALPSAMNGRTPISV